MDNLEQDFVTDVRGVKRYKKLLRAFHGRFSKWTGEQNERRHGILCAQRWNRSGLEQDLAKALKRDMHGADWLEDTEQLASCGLLIFRRRVWDGVKTASYVELPDDEKTVTFSGSGAHFAAMTFEQCMGQW